MVAVDSPGRTAMHVVIFEVTPKDGAHDGYFAIAAALRAELETIDGFISVERFESLTTPGKLLSLSTWRDEESIQRWRRNAQHAAAQAEGRNQLFAAYRIRVAEVARDYTLETSPWV
jgi:heme-degrading monooxygenase HmoA